MKKGTIVKKRLEDHFCFDLLAADGLVLCRSVDYATDEACMAAIDALRRNCGQPIEDCTVEDVEVKPSPKYEMYRNETGVFTFLLRDETGAVLVHGPDFVVQYTCKRGIGQVAQYAPTADIVVPTHIVDVAAGQALNV